MVIVIIRPYSQRKHEIIISINTFIENLFSIYKNFFIEQHEDIYFYALFYLLALPECIYFDKTTFAEISVRFRSFILLVSDIISLQN